MQLSDLALANVEALASSEENRDDCEYRENEECSEFVMNSNGTWEIHNLQDYVKKPGWG